MTDVEVFTGRDARSVTLEQMGRGTSAIASADLEGQFRIATAIANATDAVPRSYRKQPGAVLLALAWAEQHELDILTTIQNVSFIEGKAVVDATMQRALAKRAGYELRISVGESDATVTISQGGVELGGATFSMADAETAGLKDKPNWKKHPKDMLVARATTQAIKRHAPDVLLGMMSSDELDTPTALNAEETHTSDAATDQTTADPVHPSQEPPWSSVDDLRDELRVRSVNSPTALREAARIAAELEVDAPASLGQIYEHPDERFAHAFAGWLRSD